MLFAACSRISVHSAAIHHICGLSGLLYRAHLGAYASQLMEYTVASILPAYPDLSLPSVIYFFHISIIRWRSASLVHSSDRTTT